MSDTKYLVAVVLVYVAKGDGEISDKETAEMIELLNDHFGQASSESLSLLTDAIVDLEENEEYAAVLQGLAKKTSVAEKEEIALMMLKVAAANGRKDAEEMEKLRVAAEVIEIPPDTLHRAYDRYFEETQT